MRSIRLSAAVAMLLVASSPLVAQAYIAQNSGIPNPNQVETFGANLLANFAPVSTQFAGLTIFHAAYFTTGVSNNLVGGFLTNNFSAGLPNTLRIQFAQTISDVSFVYHQISTSQPSVFRAMLAGSPVFTYSYLWNQTASNNYFGFTNLAFDEVQIDFVSDFNLDTLAYRYAAGSCTIRNGSNVNPIGYVCVTTPSIGTNWQANIAPNANTLTTFLAVGPGGPHPGFPFGAGEVLIQLVPMPILFEGPGAYSFAVPNDPGLLGLQAATQGIRIDLVGPTQAIVLLNAIDLVIGT
jgi:hypothetical protein